MYDKVERPVKAIGRPPDDERTGAGVDFLRCEVCENRYTSEATD
jgi:hypothetical protein